MNLSEKKRNRMLMFLDTLKEQNSDNEEALIALNEIEMELKNKKYGLIWEKHEEEVDLMIKNNIPVFDEIKEKEITHDKDKKYNFLLEGDNLHSLKLLEKTHKEKIDVIYIDPPYNTGNDFIYDDKMIDMNDGYSHSKWISFMCERLEIAKELLSDKGVIFISIDDNEYSQLKLLMDSIFGEANFVANFIRKTGSTRAMAKYFDIRHDYVLIYAKNIQTLKFNQVENSKVKEYKNLDNDVNGTWSTQDLTVRSGGAEYEIPTIDGTKKIKRRWRFSEERMKEEMNGEKSQSFEEIYALNKKIMENGWIVVGKIVFKSKSGVPSHKKYSSKTSTLTNHTLYENIGSGRKASQTLISILNGKKFDNPKPTELLKYLIFIGGNKNSTILDFFAGSGTTGHAVMELNAEDGGNRRYIMCTNNENNIAEEITYQRMRKIQGELPHNLKYYKTSFIPKDSEELIELMMEHMVEMVQLEHGVDIDNKRYVIILDDEEMDNLEKNISKYPNLKGLYISNDVLLTSSQKKIFSSYDINYIPDYYFDFELREAGEIW